VPRARLWLAAAFLLPNLGALACGFVLDDLPVIADNEALHPHSLRQLAHILTIGYSPNVHVLGLYRPVTQIVWALTWIAAGARPWAFHALCLGLGLAVVLLVYELLLTVATPARTAFIAALLFALFPIHTEATTSVVGSAELLAAAFGFGAVILYFRRRPIWALVLFALAVFSKESAAAFAALPLAWWIAGIGHRFTRTLKEKHDKNEARSGLRSLRKSRPAASTPPSAAEARNQYAHPEVPLKPNPSERPATADFGGPAQLSGTAKVLTAAGAVGIVIAAMLAHQAFSRGGIIPPIDNPMALLDPGRRLLTALWIQCLYVWKTVVPITLSADYSYKQIPLVMDLDNWRAWAGLGLAGGAAVLAWQKREFRAPVLVYAILFSVTANVLFPIGTIMGERLAYAPSLGVALLPAILLARSRYWRIAVMAVALIFGARTAARNIDWLDADHFYPKLLETAPDSAKAQYSYGALRAARDDDEGAIAAYDRAIAIFPAYSEAYHNRGNALVRLGRREEAMASYRKCLRLDPGHAGAAYNLHQLQAGLPLNPPRKKL
jgi:hypothetical protein